MLNSIPAIPTPESWDMLEHQWTEWRQENLEGKEFGGQAVGGTRCLEILLAYKILKQTNFP